MMHLEISAWTSGMKCQSERELEHSISNCLFDNLKLHNSLFLCKTTIVVGNIIYLAELLPTLWEDYGYFWKKKNVLNFP